MPNDQWRVREQFRCTITSYEEAEGVGSSLREAIDDMRETEERICFMAGSGVQSRKNLEIFPPEPPPPPPPPVRPLQVIDFGSRDWRRVEQFQFHDWNGNQFTAEVRGTRFNVIRWGARDWLFMDTITIKSMKGGVEENALLQVAESNSNKLQYVIDGTLDWHVVKGFEFKSWSRDDSSGQSHTARTTVEFVV